MGEALTSRVPFSEVHRLASSHSYVESFHIQHKDSISGVDRGSVVGCWEFVAARVAVAVAQEVF